MVKKAIIQLHLWLGLASGLVIFIVGLTGAAWCFEKELSAVFYKSKYEVKAEAKPRISADSLQAVAQKALGDAYPITRIRYQNEADKSVVFYSFKSNKHGFFYHQKIAYSKAVYVNPYTAAVIAVSDEKWAFFNVVLAVHRTLFMGEAGSQVVAWSTVMFVVLLISGLVLWWPKNKAASRQRVWFRWKKTTSFKRRNYDLHNILGFYAFLVLLVIALTGLVWSFDWWAKSVMTVANGGKEVPKQKPMFSDTTQVAARTKISGIINQVYAAFPASAQYNINIPADKKSIIGVVVPGEGRKRYQFAQLFFDQYSGKKIGERFFKDKPTGEQARNMNIDIHTGSILGFAGKLLAFCASLIAASLPVTGFLVWRGKKKKARYSVAKVAVNAKAELAVS